MKKRFRLIRRGNRNTFYCVDTTTGKRESLGTGNPCEAERLISAKNEAVQHASMDEMLPHKKGSTADRFERAMQDKAFNLNAWPVSMF
ncbi:MAG: hypothetical protein H0X66_03325 [Verrucomicrobia bacterium]|nr:hypothetical protein [Verrucomicrobiota bacterium]